MNLKNKEKVMLVMIPYLRPDFPPLALAMMKGILDQYGVDTKSRDFNTDVHEYFKNNEIVELEKFCSDGTYRTNTIVKKIRLFFRYCIRKHILPFNPTMVGVSLFSFFMQRTTELFCLELKSFLPEVKIFLGGSGVTRFLVNGKTDDWSKIIIEKKLVDHIIIGEGEEAVIDFVREKNPGVRLVPQIKDLSIKKVLPNFEDIEVKSYQNKATTEFDNNDPVIPITGSRGCVRRCSFCNVESLWPTFVFRPAKDIVDEIENYVKTLNVRQFKFTDSLINGSSSNWRNLNQEIINRNLKIQYSGQFIAKPLGQTTQNDYDLAKQAGVSKLFIGIESGSERVRNHMKKKYDNRSLDDTITNLSQRGIKQHWMIITGYPTELEEDFQDTLDLLRRFKKYAHLISTNFVSFVLLSDSRIAYHDHYKDLKFISEYDQDDDSIVNYWICEQNPTLNFEKRLDRFYKAQEVAVECGYSGVNIDNYKKTIKNYINHKQKSNIHEAQILS